MEEFAELLELEKLAKQLVNLEPIDGINAWAGDYGRIRTEFRLALQKLEIIRLQSKKREE
jgi:hypothetical protein